MARRTPRCTKCGKMAYATVDAAIHAINGRIRVGAVPLRFYRCPHNSSKYHITKQIKA